MIDIGPLRAPEEVGPAIELWHRCGLTRPWNDPQDDLARALAAPGSTVLAGRIDGTLVATVMVGFDGHRGWVYYLAVDARFRGAGHGRSMMQRAEAWLARQGAPKLNLMVRADNAAAARFYESAGYVRSDVMVLQRSLTDA